MKGYEGNEDDGNRLDRDHELEQQSAKYLTPDKTLQSSYLTKAGIEIVIWHHSRLRYGQNRGGST